MQNQFSPAFRSSRPELRLCDELGIAFLPWSPLGGIGKAGDLGDGTRRSPRWRTRTASARSRCAWPGCWRRPPVVIPIPGASRPETIRDSAAAADLRLTEDELATLDASVDG